MSAQADLLDDEFQYISDSDGRPKAVIIPIELWREISSERETAHLLSSDAMRQRLLEAKQRDDGIAWGNVRAELGI